MEVNWPVVIVRTKELFKERLWTRKHWTRRRCWEMFLESYDQAALEISDRYASNVRKTEEELEKEKQPWTPIKL